MCVCNFTSKVFAFLLRRMVALMGLICKLQFNFT
jgi:hypothetical protein